MPRHHNATAKARVLVVEVSEVLLATGFSARGTCFMSGESAP